MASKSSYDHVVIGITPFGEPNARLTAAVCRAGGLGVLDLGAGDRNAMAELARALEWADGIGVRLTRDCAVTPGELPAGVTTIVLAADAAQRPVDLAPRRVLVEVTGVDEALTAVAAGADGLIARGTRPAAGSAS